MHSKKVGDLDYVLELPDSMNRIHNTFHVDKLFPWRGSEVNGQLPPEPGPVELAEEDDTGEPEWEVEEITDSRIFRGQLQYWLRWKGYGSQAEGWQYAKHVEAPLLVEAFHKKYPDAATAPEPKKATRRSPRRKT